MEPVASGELKGINNDHGISYDGKLLAISAGNIYTLPAAGGEPKQITNQNPSYFHGFSPDGKWMAFCAQRDNNFDIYRIPTEGGAEERLTSNPGYDDASLVICSAFSSPGPAPLAGMRQISKLPVRLELSRPAHDAGAGGASRQAGTARNRETLRRPGNHQRQFLVP
jgi:hypothetical protein